MRYKDSWKRRLKMGWLDWLKKKTSALILQHEDESEIVDYERVIITKRGIYVWDNGAILGKLYDWRDIRHIEIMVAKVLLKKRYQMENARLVKTLTGGGKR